MRNHITIAVSHFVKAGKAQAFEQALKQIIQQAKNFQGYEHIQIIPPSDEALNEYLLLIRFDNKENYQVWEQSSIRKKWSEQLENYVRQESRVRYQEGLEFWFSSPQTPKSAIPVKWKMALATWLVIYPLILILSSLAGRYLHFFPAHLRMLIVSVILVSSMTYFLMPGITKVFVKWIFSVR